MHKTALGAEFTVDWKYVDNAVDAVDNLRKAGYMVYSVEQAEGSIMLDELELDKSKKYAIVMGNEVKGVQQEVINGRLYRNTSIWYETLIECFCNDRNCDLGFIQKTSLTA